MWLSTMIGSASPAAAEINLSTPSFPRFWVLYEFCKSDQNAQAVAGAFCAGYVGALAPVMTMNGFQQTRAFAMCLPRFQAPAANAAIQAVLNWGREHPEHWSDQMLVGAALALYARWPCPGQP